VVTESVIFVMQIRTGAYALKLKKIAVLWCTLHTLLLDCSEKPTSIV
jgi:hypothetical protein